MRVVIWLILAGLFVVGAIVAIYFATNPPQEGGSASTPEVTKAEFEGLDNRVTMNTRSIDGLETKSSDHERRLSELESSEPVQAMPPVVFPGDGAKEGNVIQVTMESNQPNAQIWYSFGGLSPTRATSGVAVSVTLPQLDFRSWCIVGEEWSPVVRRRWEKKAPETPTRTPKWNNDAEMRKWIQLVPDQAAVARHRASVSRTFAEVYKAIDRGEIRERGAIYDYWIPKLQGIMGADYEAWEFVWEAEEISEAVMIRDGNLGTIDGYAQYYFELSEGAK